MTRELWSVRWNVILSNCQFQLSLGSSYTVFENECMHMYLLPSFLCVFFVRPRLNDWLYELGDRTLFEAMKFLRFQLVLDLLRLLCYCEMRIPLFPVVNKYIPILSLDGGCELFRWTAIHPCTETAAVESEPEHEESVNTVLIFLSLYFTHSWTGKEVVGAGAKHTQYTKMSFYLFSPHHFTTVVCRIIQWDVVRSGVVEFPPPQDRPIVVVFVFGWDGILLQQTHKQVKLTHFWHPLCCCSTCWFVEASEWMPIYVPIHSPGIPSHNNNYTIHNGHSQVQWLHTINTLRAYACLVNEYHLSSLPYMQARQGI